MPNTCPAIIRNGPRRSQVCGYRCRNNRTYCGHHRSLENNSNIIQSDQTPNQDTVPVPDIALPTWQQLTIATSNSLTNEHHLYWINFVNWLVYFGDCKTSGSSLKTKFNHKFVITTKKLENLYYGEGSNKYYYLKEFKIESQNTTIYINNSTYVEKYLNTTIGNDFIPNSNDWKKACLKTIALLRNVKRLSSNDTVNELCDMEEYIEFPEVITTRLLQQSGAAYNPSDDFNPADF